MSILPMSDDEGVGDDELRRIKEILEDAENTTRLSAWEEEFCDSLRERVLQYGEKTRMSARQWERWNA